MAQVDRDGARHWLDAWQGKRVGVLGDLMLDRYVWGEAHRISQEAPIPVVSVRETTARPGGAANVLHNLRSLGAVPAAFGVVGPDNAGDTLRALLADAGVETAGIVTDPDRVTTEKTRIIAGHQQVVRVDHERAAPLPPGVAEAVAGAAVDAVRAGQIDALVLEDYAKGVLTSELIAPVIAAARDCGVPLAFDPHPANPLPVPGCAVMTPNRGEAYALAGRYPHAPAVSPTADAGLAEVAAILRERFGADHALITLGADGMILFGPSGGPLHVPTRAREVYDVSGAGDTVIATYTLALCAGVPPGVAAVLANHAAGVVVGKVGTAPVTPGEWLETFEDEG